MNIHLDSADWLWATWRPFTPQPKPQSTTWDINRIREQFKKAQPRGNWRWSAADIAFYHGRAEAHFWLDLMVQASNRHYRKAADWLLEVEWDMYTGEINLTRIQALLTSARHYFLPKEIVRPLWNLCTPLEFCQLLDATATIGFSNSRLSLPSFIIAGMREQYWPLLTAEEREEWRGAIRQTMRSPLAEHPNRFEFPHPLLYWGAAVGGFDSEIEQVLLSDFDWGRYTRAYDRERLVFGLSDPARVMFYGRTTGLNLDGQFGRAWLAHTELEGLALLADQQQLDTLLCVHDAAVVPHLLNVAKQAPLTHSKIRRWLHDHSAVALAGLLPLMTDENWQRSAIQELQIFGVAGFEDDIRAAVSDHTAAVQAIVQEKVLDKPLTWPLRHTAETVPVWLKNELDTVKKAALPDWLDYWELPHLLIDGRTLLQDDLAKLCKLFSKVNNPLTRVPPVVRELRQAADRLALDTFAWALCESWIRHDFPKDGGWTLPLLAFLGGDHAALKLAPFIRRWPGEGRHARSVLGLKVLQAIGSDLALMEINNIAQRVRYKGIKKEAQRAIERIAQERHLTRDELADRLVPDCDLDEHGRRVFDYGRRQFVFVLTGDLKPMVRDENGKLRANPPKPGKLDDGELAPQAYEAWKLLKKQVRETAKVQAVRLEQALVTQRRWSVADFEQFLVNQPLMIHLTRLLLWGGYTDDGLTQLFRVTEEQDFADVDDDELLLEPTWQIGLVHPLALDKEALSAWGELFTDYELVPPFPQLVRPVYRLTAEEKERLEWQGLAEAEINGRSLMSGLISRGWERGYPQDAGMVYGHSKWFEQAGITAVVEYEGLYIESPDWGNPQGIQRCFFVPRRYIPDYQYRGQDKIPLGNVDPIIVSEVWRDLHALAGKRS